MPLRRSRPIRFVPIGVCDSLDPTETAPGAMAQLTDLIPDPTTKGVFQCRPGITGPAYTLSGQPISVMKVIGTRIYGMVRSASAPTKDIPFCYDMSTSAAVAISNINTSTNCPTTQNVTGDWAPPTMDVVGGIICVTHPGFSIGSGKYFGTIDISTPSAPVWSSGNTATNALPAVPVAVAQFNNRAYWLVNPTGNASAVYASDVLAPSTITNLNIINFDDPVPCTALAAMPLSNQSGGIVQSLMVFKGVSNIYQIQGDPALGTWSRNTLNVATGTLSPRSICSTPNGLAFVAPDGVRLISFTGQVSPPLGEGGTGIVAPFINCAEPTRISAACNASVMRISAKVQPQYSLTTGQQWQEYWYDLKRQLWTGPHTCAFTCLQPYVNTFVGALVAFTGLTANDTATTIYQSDYLQSLTSVFSENSTSMSWTWQTQNLPATGAMAEVANVEATLDMVLPSNTGTPAAATIYAYNESATQIGTYGITLKGPVWGSSIWGQFIWGGGTTTLQPYVLQWASPLVFKRLALKASGYSSATTKIGALEVRYQILGYLKQ